MCWWLPGAAGRSCPIATGWSGSDVMMMMMMQCDEDDSQSKILIEFFFFFTSTNFCEIIHRTVVLNQDNSEYV